MHKDRLVDDVIGEVGLRQAIGIKFVASLLFTYRCSIACRHCLFNCSPWQEDLCTSIIDAVKFLKQLRATDRVIHVAGGEPMLYYERLIEICRKAYDEGCPPHFIETNAYWCVDDDIVINRYEELKEVGLRGVYISADPYHQFFVPPQNVLRAYELAVKIFGRENVIAVDMSLEMLDNLREVARNEELLRKHVLNNPPKLLGRAGESLAGFCPGRPIEALSSDKLWIHHAKDGKCAMEFDGKTMWEIHIDPYGNVQTCCGIIVGNVHEKSLIEWMSEGFHTYHELIQMVIQEGPYGYLRIAKELGFKPKDEYPQLCNLCWEVRKYLHPYFPEVFGPKEIYETKFSI